MNKRQFMDKLRQLIPPSEVNEILVDFEEHFATGLSEGKTEEEIVEALAIQWILPENTVMKQR